MNLDDLEGSHILTGVDCDDNRMSMLFTLDNVTYLAVGDPDDGYRSYLGSFDVSTLPVVNKFEGIVVHCHADGDYMDMISDKTEQVCMKVGTANDDGGYYPEFVCEWDAKAAGVKESQ